MWDEYQHNDLIVAWFLRSVSPSISSRVFYLKTAAQIWSVLRTRFVKPDVARICHLQQQLCVLMQGTKSVDVYFDELSAIWEELKLYRPLPHCSCGACNTDCFEKFAALQEQDCAFKFLNGLNDSFSSVRSQITMMKPFPCLDEVYNLVLSEESQRTYSVGAGDFLAHASAMAFQRRKGRYPPLECSYCKKLGHTRDKCFRLNGYQPGSAANNNVFRSRRSLANHVNLGEDLEFENEEVGHDTGAALIPSKK